MNKIFLPGLFGQIFLAKIIDEVKAILEDASEAISSVAALSPKKDTGQSRSKPEKMKIKPRIPERSCGSTAKSAGCLDNSNRRLLAFYPLSVYN